MSVIQLVIFMAVIYAGIFFLWQMKKKKSADAFSKLDMRQEATKAKSYLDELLRTEYPLVKQQMKDLPIEAMTVARVEYTTGSQVKDVAKDTLKSLATLGTVRFQTVQTSKYMVLSGTDLHLLDTDTDGDIKNHLIFKSDRLLNSVIEEMPQPKSSLQQAKYGGYLLKSYKLSLDTDKGPVNIIFYNGITPVINSGAVKALSNNTALQVKQFVAGNYFLEKLGEINPTLKVATYLKG